MDFAPADELQDRLLGYLRKHFGHVSVERILSGPGLTNIFNFLMVESSDAEMGRRRRWEAMAPRKYPILRSMTSIRLR